MGTGTGSGTAAAAVSAFLAALWAGRRTVQLWARRNNSLSNFETLSCWVYVNPLARHKYKSRYEEAVGSTVMHSSCHWSNCKD